MPIANLDGININYRIYGEGVTFGSNHGIWHSIKHENRSGAFL